LAESPWLNLIWHGKDPVPLFDLVDDSSYTYEELLGFLAVLLKETHGVEILPIYMPVSLVKIIAKWQEFLAKKLKRQPKLPVDMLDFFRAKMQMDNGSLKMLGFKFNYPDSKKAIEQTAEWYLKEGWI